MTDDLAQSSPNEYITLSEAAYEYDMEYNSILKYVLAGRIASRILLPEEIPDVLWERLEPRVQANVKKHQGLRVTTTQAMEEYMQTRQKRGRKRRSI